MPGHKLLVKIKCARGLRDADWAFSGGSDPYVRLRIVHDDDHNKVLRTTKTKILKEGGRDPVWNEEFTFSDLATPGAYTLKLNVLDKDFLTSDDPLGEVTVPLGTLSAETGWQDFDNVWIDGVLFKSYLSFSLSTQGQWGNTPNGNDSLKVKVKKANGLRDADGMLNGKNDPYCIVSIVDSKGNVLSGPKQTSVKEEAGQDVEWNEEFIFDGLKNACASRLQLQVYDKDHYTMDDNLGEVMFHLGTLRCAEGWQDFKLALMKYPGTITFALSNEGQWGHGRKGTPICECSIQ